MWGHNLPNLVRLRLTDLPKSEGRSPPCNTPRFLRPCDSVATAHRASHNRVVVQNSSLCSQWGQSYNLVQNFTRYLFFFLHFLSLILYPKNYYDKLLNSTCEYNFIPVEGSKRALLFQSITV